MLNKRILDNVIALRIVYLLSTPFEETDAFKLGLIDDSGKQLKKAKSKDEKNATSMLHRLVWNIKKVFAIVPGGKTRIGSLAAAYLLLRESHSLGHTEEAAMQHFINNYKTSLAHINEMTLVDNYQLLVNNEFTEAEQTVKEIFEGLEKYDTQFHNGK